MFEDDAKRYESAIGWEARDPNAVALARARLHYRNATLSMLSVDQGCDIYYRAEDTPSSKPFFGSFWNSRQVAVLFGETGLGKSVLAVQIAQCLASGTALAPFESSVPAHPVLYLDFELTHRQFADRYLDNSGDEPIQYSFHHNFYRGCSDWHGEAPPEPLVSYADYLFQSISLEVIRAGAATLIIDNIAFLGLKQLSAQGAFALLAKLRTIRDELGISILLLAHTPKRRPDMPLTLNDLQGSSILSGIADSVFTVGRGLAPDIRYLKHIKARSTQMIYDASKVLLYRLEKNKMRPDSPVPPLAFTYIGFSTEAEQLGRRITDIRVLSRRVRELRESGMTQRRIAEKLGMPLTSINRVSRGGTK